MSIYWTWTQQLLSCLHPLVITGVFSKHGCWIDNGPAKIHKCLSLHADSVCWSSFGNPKYFLDAPIPCGHTYCWCAPCGCRSENHEQSDVLAFVFVNFRRARLSYHAKSSRLIEGHQFVVLGRAKSRGSHYLCVILEQFVVGRWSCCFVMSLCGADQARDLWCFLQSRQRMAQHFNAFPCPSYSHRNAG